MLSKVYGLIAIVSIAVMLAGSGFVGYLVYADKLNSDRLQLLVSVLRGELDDAAADEETTGAADVSKTESAGHGGKSVAEIDAARRHQQTQSAILERAASDASARQTLLDQTLQHLVHLQDEFGAEKAEWIKQKETLAADARDRGFKKELEYVEGLSPKQAKEHIIQSWAENKADVVRLFMAISARKGKNILGQLKTPQELKLLHELLEQLRLQDVDSLAAESRRKRGDG